MKSMDLLKVHNQEILEEVPSMRAKPTNIEQKPNEHLEEKVSEHIKDLRKHNDFLEKHLDLLLVAHDKQRTPHVEVTDNELIEAKQRIVKLEGELDLERQQIKAFKANEEKLKTDIIDLKNAMALSTRTLEDVSKEVKGLRIILSIKEDIRDITNADKFNINRKLKVYLQKQVHNESEKKQGRTNP